jgi:hypothetical protein
MPSTCCVNVTVVDCRFTVSSLDAVTLDTVVVDSVDTLELASTSPPGTSADIVRSSVIVYVSPKKFVQVQVAYLLKL